MDYEIKQEETKFKPVEIKLRIENFSELIELAARLDIANLCIKKHIKNNDSFDWLIQRTTYGNFDTLHEDLLSRLEDYL